MPIVARTWPALTDAEWALKPVVAQMGRWSREAASGLDLRLPGP